MVYEYDKVVEGWLLHEELKAAGFVVETVYSKYNDQDPNLSEPYCKIVLSDVETKDPLSIVDVHVPGRKTAEELAREADENLLNQLLALADGDIRVPDIGKFLKALVRLR